MPAFERDVSIPLKLSSFSLLVLFGIVLDLHRTQRRD